MCRCLQRKTFHCERTYCNYHTFDNTLFGIYAFKVVFNDDINTSDFTQSINNVTISTYSGAKGIQYDKTESLSFLVGDTYVIEYTGSGNIPEINSIEFTDANGNKSITPDTFRTTSQGIRFYNMNLSPHILHKDMISVKSTQPSRLGSVDGVPNNTIIIFSNDASANTVDGQISLLSQLKYGGQFAYYT